MRLNRWLTNRCTLTPAPSTDPETPFGDATDDGTPVAGVACRWLGGPVRTVNESGEFVMYAGKLLFGPGVTLAVGMRVSGLGDDQTYAIQRVNDLRGPGGALDGYEVIVN